MLQGQYALNFFENTFKTKSAEAIDKATTGERLGFVPAPVGFRASFFPKASVLNSAIAAKKSNETTYPADVRAVLLS